MKVLGRDASVADDGTRVTRVVAESGSPLGKALAVETVRPDGSIELRCYSAEHLVVSAVDQGSATRAERSLDDAGVEAWQPFPSSPLLYAKVDAAEPSQVYAALTRVSEAAGSGARVELDAITFDGALSAPLVPIDPKYPLQWHLERIGAPQAWRISRGDPSIVVAVVDSGVHVASPEFAGRLVPGYNFVDDNDDVSDDLGHGTRVSGVLAANASNEFYGAGVDWKCSLMPVKIYAFNNGGLDSWYGASIDFATVNAARVINISWSSGPSHIIRAAVNRAVLVGVIVVAGSGNSSNQLLNMPARLPGVIAVGASNEQDERASFSVYGNDLDMVAPGTNMYLVSHDGREWISYGTSHAAPQVSAAAALILSIRPELDAEGVAALLYAGADDLGEPGWDAETGWGRLNLFNSLTLARTSAVARAVSGGVRVEWEAPLNAEGRVRYRIERSEDLLEWTEAEDPEILFDDRLAYWTDIGASGTRFYRVSAEAALDLSPRVARRFDEGEPYSLFVLYAKEIDPFEPDPEALAAYNSAVAAARAEGAAQVEGYYRCVFEHEAFPYSMSYMPGEPRVLMSEEGKRLQELAAPLTRWGVKSRDDLPRVPVECPPDLPPFPELPGWGDGGDPQPRECFQEIIPPPGDLIMISDEGDGAFVSRLTDEVLVALLESDLLQSVEPLETPTVK